MKTNGDIQDAVCDAMIRFEEDCIGSSPKAVHAHLIGDVLVVRLQGVLTVTERQLLKTLPLDRSRLLLKQVCAQLLATARPLLEASIEEITGVKLLNLYHDISTVTGEEMMIFTLTAPPLLGGKKRRQAPATA